MSRYLHLARQRGLASSGPLRGPSLVSGKALRRGLSARDAAQLMRYDWAHPEPGIDQDEFFDDQFERRAHELGPRSTTNLVQVTDPKNGAWTGLNQLGVQVDFAPQENNEQTVLRLDEWGMPRPWTLTLGLDIRDDGLPQGGFDVTALIFFGSGGVTQYLEMDWLQGATITLPMNALNVVARYSFGFNEAGATLPEGLRLRSSLCRYATTTGRATRNYAFDGSTADNLVVPIPPFAKNLLVYPTNLSVGVTPFDFYGGNFQIRFFTDEAGNEHVGTYAASQLLTYVSSGADEFLGSPQPLPIPRKARFAAITNALGAIITSNNLSVAFQYEVGL